MNGLNFNLPPFPTLIKAGKGVFKKGQKHFKRTFIVFDLLYVTKGSLYMQEADEKYEVRKGEYLILVPGLEHFGNEKCSVDTEFVWIHFLIPEAYHLVIIETIEWSNLFLKEETYTEPPAYQFLLPRYGRVGNCEWLEGTLSRLLSLNEMTNPENKLQQQVVFAELILLLQKEALSIPSAAEKVTEKTLAYIQEHFKLELTMNSISNGVHFHPDYVTRCMQKTMGMTPIQYLQQYRLFKAKQLLSSSNEKVMSISRQVGIEDYTYFSKLFKQIEGITPMEYRKMSKRS